MRQRGNEECYMVKKKWCGNELENGDRESVDKKEFKEKQNVRSASHARFPIPSLTSSFLFHTFLILLINELIMIYGWIFLG